jgi:outer membrane protein assembly factor BamB
MILFTPAEMQRVAIATLATDRYSLLMSGLDSCRVERRPRFLASAVVIVAVGLGIGSWSAGCRVSDPFDPNKPRTADVVWQVSYPAFGPPALDDSSVYFALRDHRIMAVNRADGAIRWAAYSGTAGSNLVTVDSPVRTNDVVVFGDEYLFGFEPMTGGRRWIFGQTGGTEPRVGVYPFKADGLRIYSGSAVGSAFAIDAATGTQVWRTDLIPGTDNQVRIMSVRNGVVYLTLRYNGPRYRGSAYALDATTGASIWSFELPTQNGSPNATRDGILAGDSLGSLFLVSFDDGRIAALDALTGALRWTIPAMSLQNDDRRMTASGKILVATSTAPDLIAGYDLATGTERWRTLSDQGSAGLGFGKVSSDADLAYVVFTNGYIAAYDLQTGARPWVQTAPLGFFVDAPLVGQDTFFLGGNLAVYAIRK